MIWIGIALIVFIGIVWAGMRAEDESERIARRKTHGQRVAEYLQRRKAEDDEDDLDRLAENGIFLERGSLNGDARP